MLSKYKTIHILLTNVHLDCRGEGSSNRNASRDESVETRDESVETRDEFIEAGGKLQQSFYNYILPLKCTRLNLTHHWGLYCWTSYLSCDVLILITHSKIKFSSCCQPDEPLASLVTTNRIINVYGFLVVMLLMYSVLIVCILLGKKILPDQN